MTISSKRIKEVLKPEALKDFNEFMIGQTVSIEGIYDDDFLRWMKRLPVVD